MLIPLDAAADISPAGNLSDLPWVVPIVILLLIAGAAVLLWKRARTSRKTPRSGSR